VHVIHKCALYTVSYGNIITGFYFFYRVLDRLGPRALSAHLRTFADYMVYELNLSGVSGQNINKVCYSISWLQSLAFHSWDFFGFLLEWEGY